MSQYPPTGQTMPYANFLPPAKLRPTAVTVIAIIAIVFGSISVLANLCGVGGLIMNSTGSNPFLMTSGSSTMTVTGPNGTTTTVTAPANPGVAMAQQMNAVNRDPVIVGGNAALIALKLIIAIIEIWAGASLLGLKPAARIWIMCFAVADIIVGIAGLIFMILVVQPKMAAVTQSISQQPNAPPGSAQMTTMIMQLGVYGGLAFAVLLLVWPVVILYFMSRPPVKAAFGASPG